MNIAKIVSAAIMTATLVVTTPVVFAGMAGEATKTMAEIAINVRHYPSDADKEKLKKIAADTTASAQERAIATAMLNMEHHVTDADKAKLNDIGKDAAAPQAVKDLASVLVSLNHKPSEADVTKLKAITK